MIIQPFTVCFWTTPSLCSGAVDVMNKFPYFHGPTKAHQQTWHETSGAYVMGMDSFSQTFSYKLWFKALDRKTLRNVALASTCLLNGVHVGTLRSRSALFVNLFISPEKSTSPSIRAKGFHSRRLHTKVPLHHMRSRKSFSIKRYNPMLPERRWRRKFRQPQIAISVCGSLRNYSTKIGFSSLFRTQPFARPQMTRILGSSYTRHQLSGPPKVVWRQTQLLITPSKASSSEKLMERKNCCKCVEDFFTLPRRPPTTGSCSRPS